MGQITILPETTKNPISLIGQRAGICWGADISDPAKNYKRGWDCIESGHGRTLEYAVVDMVIEGYSARVIREYTRHVGGAPTYLQASTRYIDYEHFSYIMPPSIGNNDKAMTVYTDTMETISIALGQLEKMGIPREDIANLLPLGMTTKIVDHRNVRNLIDMSRQRECERALWEIRGLFRDIKLALANYSEEWAKVVSKCFYPKCQETQTCPESKGCGRYPKREGR